MKLLPILSIILFIGAILTFITLGIIQKNNGYIITAVVLGIIGGMGIYVLWKSWFQPPCSSNYVRSYEAYCGKKDPVPQPYQRRGTPYECLKKGIGFGRCMNRPNKGILING